MARSLGFAAYSKEKYVKDKKYYRIRVSGDISQIPTRVKRKRGNDRAQIKNVLRTGIEIEHIGYGDYYGFELDGDGLYCLGDFTVTHNSTFAQGLAEFYAGREKIVKTVESPRDLILPDSITQYAISHGDAQEIHDILLLSRPDYVIFDEMRNTSDFALFADLRLAGVGMVGVVHATNPIDAIQRFIGRIEMGVIPQIIDTVIFIKNGFIDRVLHLKMTVKVPTGMTEADLARPVVVVNDFETGKLMFEIYSYGEQTVVIPVNDEVVKSGVHRLAEEGIKRVFRDYTDRAEVQCVSDHKCIVKVPEKDIARIIGKEGKTVNQLEEQIGMSIEVQTLGEKAVSTSPEGKKEIPFSVRMKKNCILFELGIKMQNKDVGIYLNDGFVLTAKAGKTGVIKIKQNNSMGRMLTKAYDNGEKIKIMG